MASKIFTNIICFYWIDLPTPISYWWRLYHTVTLTKKMGVILDQVILPLDWGWDHLTWKYMVTWKRCACLSWSSIGKFEWGMDVREVSNPFQCTWVIGGSPFRWSSSPHPPKVVGSNSFFAFEYKWRSMWPWFPLTIKKVIPKMKPAMELKHKDSYRNG